MNIVNFYWDIDLTILTTGGAGLGALKEAISSYCIDWRDFSKEECGGTQIMKSK
jgi:hypothetical protein